MSNQVQEPRVQVNGMTDGETVGIVLISHSGLLADGLAELLVQLGGSSVPVAAAGGTDDGGLGTSLAKVEKAIRSVDRGAGVLLFPDLGSSVLTAKTVLGSGHDLPEPLAIADVPFVEGAISAAVIAGTGASFEVVLAAAEEARIARKL
jgi:phosphoenolpyruvate---glycerone phosphotransferase subunit DhaM